MAGLGVGSVVIVGIAVVAVALRSKGLLEELADQEGLIRAQLATASAHEYLERAHESVAMSARLLARLPGLHRLLQANDPDVLGAYLKNYCEATSAVDGCAVIDGATLVGFYGPGMPWPEAVEAYFNEGRKFMLAPAGDQPIMLGASSGVRDVQESIRTLTLRRIDRRMLDDMADQIGAPVRLSRDADAAGASDKEWSELHAQAFASRRPVSARLELAKPLYAASMPMPVTAGEVTAFIDVDLEAKSSDAIVADLATRLAATALTVIGIAALAGILYGRWLVRPVASLGKAASRIGGGDFLSEIPAGGVQEVAALGASMEEMRRNLVEVTAALKQREAEAHAVLSGIVEGVYAVDMERRIRYANPQVARMLKRAPEDLIGRFCGDVLNPEPVNGVRPCDNDCPILAARTNAREGVAAERVRKISGKTKSMVIVSAAPVNGQQVQVLRDETELEAVRRARDSVLANITHEFRTPLAAQMASVELLHDKLDTMSPGERERVIRNIQRGGLRLMQLIDNMLESVRIDAGQLAIRQQSVSLAEVIAETEELMAPLLHQRRQQIMAELPPGLPDVVGDEARLVQVFVNLLANAIKFAPESSVIRVGAAGGNEMVTAWVEDEGPGIVDSDRGAIFQAFQRSMNGEPRAPGLGIGLWIVKSIVERHRGTVDVERTAAGHTRFNIRLPVETLA
jgi:signal transduction histidine kinase